MTSTIRASMQIFQEFAGFKEAKTTCKITRGDLHCHLEYHAKIDKISFQFFTKTKPVVSLRRYGKITVYVDQSNSHVVGGWLHNVSFDTDLTEFYNMLWANTPLDSRMIDKLVSAVVNCLGAYNPTDYDQPEYYH